MTIRFDRRIPLAAAAVAELLLAGIPAYHLWHGMQRGIRAAPALILDTSLVAATAPRRPNPRGLISVTEWTEYL
jgi:hypothetical protein